MYHMNEYQKKEISKLEKAAYIMALFKKAIKQNSSMFSIQKYVQKVLRKQRNQIII